jgi:hypothetical protein
MVFSRCCMCVFSAYSSPIRLLSNILYFKLHDSSNANQKLSQPAVVVPKQNYYCIYCTLSLDLLKTRKHWTTFNTLQAQYVVTRTMMS